MGLHHDLVQEVKSHTACASTATSRALGMRVCPADLACDLGAGGRTRRAGEEAFLTAQLPHTHIVWPMGQNSSCY